MSTLRLNKKELISIQVRMLTFLNSFTRLYIASIVKAFHTADISASFGILSLSRLRHATFTCLYTGKFAISTVKSRYSQCFNFLKLFYEDRQYPKKWPILAFVSRGVGTIRRLGEGGTSFQGHFWIMKGHQKNCEKRVPNLPVVVLR